MTRTATAILSLLALLIATGAWAEMLLRHGTADSKLYRGATRDCGGRLFGRARLRLELRRGPERAGARRPAMGDRRSSPAANLWTTLHRRLRDGRGPRTPSSWTCPTETTASTCCAGRATSRAHIVSQFGVNAAGVPFEELPAVRRGAAVQLDGGEQFRPVRLSATVDQGEALGALHTGEPLAGQRHPDRLPEDGVVARGERDHQAAGGVGLFLSARRAGQLALTRPHTRAAAGAFRGGSGAWLGGLRPALAGDRLAQHHATR